MFRESFFESRGQAIYKPRRDLAKVPMVASETTERTGGLFEGYAEYLGTRMMLPVLAGTTAAIVCDGQGDRDPGFREVDLSRTNDLQRDTLAKALFSVRPWNPGAAELVNKPG